MLIHRCESAIGRPVEDKASGCRKNTAPGLGTRRSQLRNLPSDFTCVNVDGAQKTLTRLIRIPARFTRTFFERHEIVEPRLRGEGGRIPVGGITWAAVRVGYERATVRAYFR